MRTAGIIGGMGPLATVDLFAKITKLTKAETDQEHIPVLIDSNTNIADRTAAILAGGASPVPELVRSALRLECMGADMLAMSCNTAHYFADEIKKYTRLPLVHMIDETAQEAKRRGYRRVGLLATTGTCQTGIYDKAFAAQGVELIKPDDELEAHIMDLIYRGVKAGIVDYPLAGVTKTLAALKEAGAEVFILGCTELPLAFSMYHIDEPSIDPTETLARRIIELAGKQVVG